LQTKQVTAVDGNQKSEQSTTSQDVAIWISLADLQGKTLEEYLLQTWLKKALKDVEVTPEKQIALGELFKSGRVWLLLDGVDEMGIGSPLVDIASQLTGWVAEARVMLTCRMNVWQAKRNELEAFETYRLLDFDYPDQVHQFIDKWFHPEPNSLNLAQRLKDELAKTEQVRIRDLVQNPLRLALLCSTWKHWQGSLPQTKAGLYKQFVRQFYIWKRTAFPTTLEQRRQLNAGLGRLALRDIEVGVSRFRLTESFIEEELGDPEDPGSLFYLALRLAWLNDVGVAAENPDEKVYAFFHPTFEEYFAALAIEDWHFFLNHVPHNPDEGSYHIFEPRWKEVILLWLGRENVEKAQKEEFIKALVEFEDGCNGLYWFRAYFLAAIGISEFKECTKADEIVDKIVKWGFGYFNIEKQQWQEFLDPIEEGARATISETDRSRAIAALVELLSSTTDAYTRIQAADSLEKIDPGNEKAIAALVELLSSTADKNTRWATES
jgi:predicted NACHT family NTPase